MLKSKPLNFTPVSNIFIEKYMPKARGEFIKVYLLMLKHNFAGEIGVNSSILSTSLNLLESDIINALNYWNEEGVIRLSPIDKMGNFDIEFIDLLLIIMIINMKLTYWQNFQIRLIVEC